MSLLQELWLDELLNRADKSNDAKIKVTDNGLYIRTPRPLIDDLIKGIIGLRSNISDARILVIDTVEFIPALLTFGAKQCNITFVAPYAFKGKIASSTGVTIIEKSVLDWTPEKTMKFDIVIGNPPYTDGTHAANEIYTTIIDKVCDICDPDILAMITPENMLNGGQKKRALREKLTRKYKFSHINFLHIARDWDGKLGIDTASWVMSKNHFGKVSIKGRQYQEVYLSDQVPEYVNGETQEIYNWLWDIQTSEKIKLKMSKKSVGVGKELRISKDSVDSAKIIDGSSYDSHNNEWRVAFGYLRTTTCAIVPPGISIPQGYRYKMFGQDECLARKFADYMMSSAVRFIMKLTYTSRSLDNPQLSFIPAIDLSIFNTVNDEELFKYWECPDLAANVSKLIGKEVPF